MLEILAVLLNDGVSPTTGARLLKKSTVDSMFVNQIPSMPDFGRQGIPAANPILTNPIPEIYPFTRDPKAPQGWGLTFMLTLEDRGLTGRKKGTAHWGGLANLWWWADRESGVAGLICSQFFPFADAQVFKLWHDIESEVYKGLEESQSKL